MIDIQKDVFARLAADTSLASIVGTYGDAVAIFTDYVPSDFVIGADPALVVDAPFDNADFDTFNQYGRTIQLNVRCYHKPDGNSLSLMQAAERARTVLKLWPAGSITAADLVDATVTGPVSAPTDDPALSGLLLSVRLIIQET